MPSRSIVLVTGASKGIGAATAIAFARAGYDVCVNYHSDAEGASATAERCEAEGAKAIAVGADVSDRNAVKNLFRTCDELLGPIDCLVNNAGIIGGTSTLESLTEGALQATFATNLFGTIYCLQEAIERMASDRGGTGGSIVNMSSLAATLGSPGEYVHYAASKGAVETLTIGAGKELGSVGVRVNAIRVGTTATDIHAREGNPDRPGKVARATPLGRIAEPEDIADAAVWLASPMARFITGTILTVAGGIAP
jgi:NAD(P)-dependent dehydrogenase (short-subunit alcohol dehydrogenase family)